MEIVYVVITNYPYEGYGEPKGVFSSEEKALAAIETSRQWYEKNSILNHWRTPDIIQYTLDKEESL
jgi:hypothetical protein